MAFQFVPNADGSFTEGDKQTNPETNQEYIFTDGAWRALGIEVATDLSELDARYLKLSGGTLTNGLAFNKGGKPTQQFGIEPNSSTPDTNIYSLQDGQMRFRSTHTESTNDRVGSHIVLDPNGGTPETKIYNVVTPTNGAMAVNKDYVDQAISNALADLIGSDGGSDTNTPILRPALLSWQYEGNTGTTATTPGSGGFNYHEASSGSKFLRFSFNSSNGCKLGDGKFSDTTEITESGPIGTIWEWMDGNVAKFKLKRIFRVKHWRWNYQISSSDDRHFEFKLDSSHGHDWSTFSAKEYFISVGGFF